MGIQMASNALGYSLDVRLALDSDQVAMNVYQNLFPSARTFCVPIEDLFDGEIGSPNSETESEVKRLVGPLDILLGGPPCQGHSNLNNYSRRDDPRNGLYIRIARAAEVLHPSAILAENVPTVTYDVRKTVHQTIGRLSEIGYTIGQDVVDLSNLGVPQKRRRHVIIAVQEDYDIDVQRVLERLKLPICDHIPRNVQWAISDLEDVIKPNLFNSPSQPYPINQSRINWLFDNDESDLPNVLRPRCHRSDHSYTAMYGRMKWDLPAQTVTTGFNCIGQGRYIHPSRRRVITPHEAARLQMIPDFVDFSTVTARKHLAKLIGNSVPPPLAFVTGKLMIPHLRGMSLSSQTIRNTGRRPS